MTVCHDRNQRGISAWLGAGESAHTTTSDSVFLQATRSPPGLHENEQRPKLPQTPQLQASSAKPREVHSLQEKLSGGTGDGVGAGGAGVGDDGAGVGAVVVIRICEHELHT